MIPYMINSIKIYDRNYFVEQGKKGIKSRNKKLTKKQLSEIAKKGWETRKRK